MACKSSSVTLSIRFRPITGLIKHRIWYSICELLVWEVVCFFWARNRSSRTLQRVLPPMIWVSNHSSALRSASILPFLPGLELMKVFRTPSACTLICHRLRLSIHAASFFLSDIKTPFVLPPAPFRGKIKGRSGALLVLLGSLFCGG